jgi:hypothetical protein
MNDELNNYTFAEFINLPDNERNEYKTYGLHAKGRNMNGKPALEWQWGRVKQIQDIINQRSLSYNDLAEIIALAAEKSTDEVMLLKWHEVFKFYNFIVKEIEAINEKEQQLGHEPDIREINAGIENYSKFGWFCSLYRLSGGDPLKYDEIGKQPYSVIFSTLLMQKTDSDYERALIKQNQNSRSDV